MTGSVRRVIAVRFCDGLAVQMLTVAVGWQVYSLTRDPLLLGLIGLAEGLPYIAVALWAGHLADRREKASIVVVAEGAALAGACGLTFLARQGNPPLLPIYLLVAWSGLCRSFQWTALSAYLQQAVPRAEYPRAAALNTSVWHAATIAGPALGGFIYGGLGAAAAYGAVAACFAAAWAGSWLLDPIPPEPATAETSRFEGLLSGLRFVFSRQAMIAAMSLDMLGVLFGGVDGVLPMFAAAMGAGPSGLGLLRAAPAAGALLSSLYLAHRQPLKKMGAAFVAAVGAYGFFMIGFAFSRAFWLSLLLLGLSGVVDGMGMVIRATLYQALTPDALRGRVSAVNGIFIRTSNQIGSFESGLAAKLLGLVPSVVLGGCVTVVCAAVAAWKAPELRRFESAG